MGSTSALRGRCTPEPSIEELLASGERRRLSSSFSEDRKLPGGGGRGRARSKKMRRGFVVVVGYQGRFRSQE